MNAILHLKVPWADSIMMAPTPCAKVTPGPNGTWSLLLRLGNMPLNIPLTPHGQPLIGNQPVWVLERLGPTVVALNPSVVEPRIAVNLPDGTQSILHAYVVVYDCPEDLGGYPEPQRKPA